MVCIGNKPKFTYEYRVYYTRVGSSNVCCKKQHDPTQVQYILVSKFWFVSNVCDVGLSIYQSMPYPSQINGCCTTDAGLQM